NRIPGRLFECYVSARSAWCTKAELNGRLIQSTTNGGSSERQRRDDVRDYQMVFHRFGFSDAVVCCDQRAALNQGCCSDGPFHRISWIGSWKLNRTRCEVVEPALGRLPARSGFRLSFTPVCRRFRNRNSRLAFLFGKLHSQHEILKPGVIMQESQPGIHPEK